MQRLVFTCCLVAVCSTLCAREPLPAPGYFEGSVLGEAQPTPVGVSQGPPFPVTQTPPIPQSPYVEPVPTPVPTIVEFAPQPVVVADPVQLYPRVIVHHPGKKDPYSIPTVIAVPDPRPTHRGCSVCVEVCMPPCDNPSIRCSRLGNRVTYDFGRFKIRTTSLLGFVHVDYLN